MSLLQRFKKSQNFNKLITNKVILKISILLLFIVVNLFSQINLYSQINTEVLRVIKPEVGYYHNINLELGLNKGNSELFRVRTGYRVDFVDSIDRAFAVINYENAQTPTKQIINRGFIHLRYMENFNQGLEYEYFAQKEFNQFTRLLDRNVLGSNVRFNIFNEIDSAYQLRLSLGNGLMYENESINQSYIWTTNLIRSNSYLSLFFKYNETLTFSNVFFYQMAMNRFLDRRYLNNSMVFFNINKNLRLTVRLTFFYDNEPPPNVKPLDLELVNGINIDF